jgi:transaldolase/glucose-6-phosphate isomerase
MSTPTSTVRTLNPLARLAQQGQSIWLDYIKKSLMDSGELAKLLAQDDLRGMTSNPAIFEKAIAGSADYAAALKAAGARCATDTKGVYEEIAIADIQRAADVLRPVYEKTQALDGYVSLEVSPLLARDTAATLAEARRLWKSVARPNLMIKVPGTSEGVPAIRALIAEGISVNVTLLFSNAAYERVALAYIEGLEERAKAGRDLAKVASVASFFVSRIDSAIDAQLDALAKNATGDAKARIDALRGRAAIANAKLAYQLYKRICGDARWRALAAKGAQPQRLLWASTGTKDARYRDVVYVEELVGAETVNTIPPATYDAFRDHGNVAATLEQGLDRAKMDLSTLAGLGISLDAVTDKLLADGIKLFEDAFHKLLGAVAAKADVDTRIAAKLPPELGKAVDAALADWRGDAKSPAKVQRLFARDAAMWTGGDEARWLGWLDVVERQSADPARFAELAKWVRDAGVAHVVLLGMGGSSLAPEVFRKVFGRQSGAPEFLVLDSTDPAQIAAIDAQIDPARTLFVVASKSGSTLEPNVFKAYFFERAKAALGANAGSRFLAITDPGSSMEQVAKADRFARIEHGESSIGGRYSALSNFGLVPAALQGIDVAKILVRAREMASLCAPSAPAERNPGLQLGLVLGCAAARGRDKLTLLASPALRPFGAWVEQLVAESTGKHGKAIVPVDLEAAAAPAKYGNDRLFAAVLLDGDADPALDATLAALEAAGQPVVRVRLRDRYDLGAEMYRWEIATAVAGAVLGIHPFDQPDVEASKVETRKLTSAYEKSGSLPAEAPVFADGAIRVFASDANARALGGAKSLAAALKAHFARIGAGDYFGVLAYVQMNAQHEAVLAKLRHLVRDKKRVATCVGFGPRFLHSTGQAYKGGPASGVFLQITCDDARDLPIPGAKYTFGVVKAAQARGDLAVLEERGRRALRVHIGADVQAGLAQLLAAAEEALR